MSGATERYDVVVIGGGQAGIANGYYLAQQGVRFLILEREHDVAAAWRDRWDSLTLFTPRVYDSLPGLEFPGDPDGYPTRAEVLAYLQGYAAHFDLPVRLGTRAKRLSGDSGEFLIELDDGAIAAGQVVVATGPFQEPRIPAIAERLAPDVVHLHSASYRRPSDLPPGRTLVVGGGNTGYQIAHELAAAGRETHIAIGTRQAPLPQRLFGRDLFFFLTKTGLIYKTVDSRVGRRMSQKETLVGPLPKIAKRLGVISHGRAAAASERTVTFADGDQIEVDGVVWATGFRYDHSWIDLPIAGPDGVRHRRGVTEVPGLYTLGMQWQHTRGSALLGFVKDDAAFIAEQIAERSRRLNDGARSHAREAGGDLLNRPDGAALS